MKNKFIIAAFFVAGITMATTQAGAQSTATNVEIQSSGQRIVRLIPNPGTSGSLTALSSSGQPVNLYLFDLEGTLMQSLVLHSREKKTISELKKGIYLYDVFMNDESIVQGKITVK